MSSKVGPGGHQHAAPRQRALRRASARLARGFDATPARPPPPRPRVRPAGPCRSSRRPGSRSRDRRSARPRAISVSRFFATAGCSNMLVFIAGASSTGALVAMNSDERKSSARPLANLPTVLAVAGATSSRSMVDAIEMCSMSALAPAFHWSVITSRRVIASKVSGPDELGRRAGHHRDHLVAVLLEPARDLDRLVGADAAGHAECDECHEFVLRSSLFVIARTT